MTCWSRLPRTIRLLCLCGVVPLGACCLTKDDFCPFRPAQLQPEGPGPAAAPVTASALAPVPAPVIRGERSSGDGAGSSGRGY